MSQTVIVKGAVITVAIIGILLLLVWGVSALAPVALSDLTGAPGCTPMKIPVAASGTIDVTDSAGILTLRAIPKLNEVHLDAVTKTLAFLNTAFVAKVEVWQAGQKLGSSGLLDETLYTTLFRGSVPQEVPYTVQFVAPDNNCDGKVDPFKAELRVTVDSERSASEGLTRPFQYNADGTVVLT